ncbi:hypothetical protein MBLNU459_g6475t1 [Dothideomycetes sp. NU459]
MEDSMSELVPAMFLLGARLNMTKLAGLTGMTNPKSAANAWLAIKKKLKSVVNADPVAGSDAAAKKPTPKKPAPNKGAPNKRKAASAPDTDDDDDDEAAPVVKQQARRAGRARKVVKKNAKPELGEDEDETVDKQSVVKAEASDDDDYDDLI